MTSALLSPDKLDEEFKKHLLLIRSHLIENGSCSYVGNIAAWIQKLAKSRTLEKLLRNQYLLMLYHQLSADRIEKPFSDKPPGGDLPQISSEVYCSNADESTRSSSPTVRIEDSEQVLNVTEISPCHREATIVGHAMQGNKEFMPGMSMRSDITPSSTPGSKTVRYACSSVGSGVVNEVEHHRRDDRVESDTMQDVSGRATPNFYMRNFDDVLAKEIENVKTKHRFELVNMRTWHEEDVLGLRSDYTDKLEKMKGYYTKKIQEIEQRSSEVLEDTEQVLVAKDEEIVRLEGVIQKKCSNLQVQVSTMRGRLCANTKLLRLVAKLERVVSKLERLIAKQSRSKARLIREYEGKLSAAQRKTDLVECTLKLYMMKHREEHGSGSAPCSQSEISKAVDKLEQKYKEVVASVQVAAIKRRLKDQKSIEHLLQLTRNPPTLEDLEPANSNDSRLCTSESGDGTEPFSLESEGKNRLRKMLTMRNKSR